MVSIQEAKGLIQERRQDIVQQRQQIEQARQEVRQTELRKLTRAELQRRTREDLVARKFQAQQLEGLKESQLTQLKPLETQVDIEEEKVRGFQQEIKGIETQISKQRQRQIDFKLAKKLFIKGIVDPGASSQIKKFIREFEARREIILTKSIREGVKEAKKIAEETAERIKTEATIPKRQTGILTQEQIAKLNIKDPLKSFIVSTLPLFGKTIFEDFVNNPKDRQAIRNSLSNLQKKGDENIEKLEKTRLKVEEFFDPRQKEFRIETKKNFDVLENTQEQLNKDIGKFNKKFVGELTQIQFDDATQQATAFTARQRAIDQRTFELGEKVKRLRGSTESEIETFFKSTLKGIATSPITLAQLGIGLSTRPIKTTKDFSAAIKDLPTTLSRTPFSTSGQLLGVAVGTAFISDFIVSSPQLFKGGKVPIGKGALEDALRKGGKPLDDVIERLKRFAKDKKGEIQISLILKKKKKKKKRKPLEDFTDIIEDMNEIGNIKAKNQLIDKAVKGMLERIRKAKTPEQKQKMTDALKGIMEVWARKKLITMKPLVFQVTGKPRAFDSKRGRSELRIVPKRQTTRQKELIFRLKRQRQKTQLFEIETTRILKRQRQQLLKKQAIALGLIQKTRQTQTQKDRQALASALSDVSAQASSLKSSQKESFKQSTALASALLSTQAQLVSSKLAPAQILIGRPITRIRVRPKPKPKIVRIIGLPKGVENTKLVKALQKLGKKGADVIVGQKLGRQKTIARNLPAFKALKLGKRFTDTNIEASFRLKPSGKKAKGKDIKPFNVGIKFRPSKVNPLFIVEKRAFRLDFAREKAQLQAARRAKVKLPSGFFPTIKKKRKK